ncbi:hypothetical protein BS50DRAFT_575533 [Corynespora cassiicola Philippines]|uniref:Uncharacterized protein n=1 Tax=Corynespora cassiicola Philippines TaxID=1448308 RepID=A0A2T2NJF2_CORCC|nr:hypothetical protein BS50DRAFT_575533 [Corynespora cassiicola Philippines]
MPNTLPTFLGQSLNTPVGTNPPDTTTMATEVHVHIKRVAAKTSVGLSDRTCV